MARNRHSAPRDAARRTVPILVKATPAEAALLATKAAAAGLPRATYVRRAALGHRIVGLRVPAIDLAAVGELRRLGAQLDHALRLVQLGRLAPAHEPALTELRTEIDRLARALRRTDPIDPADAEEPDA